MDALRRFFASNETAELESCPGHHFLVSIPKPIRDPPDIISLSIGKQSRVEKGMEPGRRPWSCHGLLGVCLPRGTVVGWTLVSSLGNRQGWTQARDHGTSVVLENGSGLRTATWHGSTWRTEHVNECQRLQGRVQSSGGWDRGRGMQEPLAIDGGAGNGPIHAQTCPNYLKHSWMLQCGLTFWKVDGTYSECPESNATPLTPERDGQ